MKNVTKLFVLATAITFLGGCAAVLVGGGAAGGYYYEKDKRQINQYSHDGWITSKIKTKYVKDLALKSFVISVTTNHGVVSLAGNVPTEKYRQRAINVAMNTKGVKGVNAQNLIIHH